MTNVPACFHCAATDEELRPFGPQGAYVCAPCSQLDENRAETERQYRAQVEAAGQLALFGGG